MRKLLSALVVLSFPALGLWVAAPATAAVPVWSISTVTGTAAGIVRDGGTQTVSVNCPTNYTPIEGHVVGSAADDLRRLSEQIGIGSGASYSATMVDYSSGGSITITPVVRCVPMTYFSATPVQVSQQASDLDDTNHLIQIGLDCPAGYLALSASTTFPNNPSSRTVLTTAPTSGLDTWESVGWVGSSSSSMKLQVNCVPAADLPGLKTYTHLDSVGWGAGATASCATGLVPITGGTVHVGGDGGAITVNQAPTPTGWTSMTLSLSTGAMQSIVACLPGSSPTVSLTGSEGYTQSTSASWTFSGSDPASAGGYSLSLQCRVFQSGGASAPFACSSPYTMNSLADGSYSLGVTAVTSDGRRSGEAFRNVVVDTTDPTATFADAAGTVHGTASPTLGFTSADANPVTGNECWVDSAGPCTPTNPTFGGSHTASLSGLTQGNHTLHVKVTDAAGNNATYDLPFVVDLSAPGVTFAKPAGSYFRSASPAPAFTVVDAVSAVTALTCGADAGALSACGTPSGGDYRGAQSASLSGLSEGAHTLHVHAVDAGGNAATYDFPFVVDTVAPTATLLAPTVPFQLPLSTTVRWSGSDASGIATYAVRSRSATYATGFGAYTAPTSYAGTVTSHAFGSLVPGTTTCYQVRSVDKAGNVSPWTAERCTAVPLDERGLTRSSGWTATSATGWFQGTALSTNQLGATLTKHATLRRIQVVALTCATCGVVQVTVGTVQIARINLAAATTQRKAITLPVFSLRTGTVTLKVVTSGKLVRVDALGLSRS